MKRNTKRFLSLFVSVPMTLNLMATPVSAAAPDATANPVVTEQETTITMMPETITDPQENTEEVMPETTTDPQENTEEEIPETIETPQENETEMTPEVAETSPENEIETVPETIEQLQQNTETTVPVESSTITVEDSLSTFTIDASKIEVPEINVNEMQLTDEELNAVDESDPEITTIKEELENIKVLNDDGESVALTPEQIKTVLGMYTQYQQQWQANADVLGVQNPFYLQFNDDGEDGLGVLGEMLTLAGVSVDDVRNGNYTYDDLTGMIMNFLYGDKYGVQFYGDVIREKRDEALKTVEDSGAQTDVQKILVLNTWLAQNNTFDMSYIMNQMGDDPVMTAEEPQQHEHYQEIYSAMEEVYRPQIEAQFQTQFRAVAEQQVALEIYKSTIKTMITEQYQNKNPDATEEEVNTYVEQYMTDNAEAIAADPRGYIVANLGGEEVAAQVEAQVNAYLASEEGQAIVENAYTQIMDTQIPDLGNMTPNQAIEVYTQQAATGLTEGILGYWEGNHIGALAEGKSVCMGYAKAFAYLMQCMYPEYYGVNGEGTDLTVASNWKTAADLYYDEEGNLDINQDYNVDLVRITFNASVNMYGIPQPDFNSDHFWNAVKVDGKWYYVDPCYTDVFSEVMNRDRVETDGYMNHTYFMISHSSLAEMFAGNYTVIKTLYADCDGTVVNADYTSDDYEGSWVNRVVSNVYSDGEYIYYMYDSTDMSAILSEFNNSNNGEMDIEDPVYKVVRHKMDEDDKGDGDSDYETIIDFNSGDSVTVLNPETGELETNEMLTDLYTQFEEEQALYPAIHTTPILYDGKLYFNVSNRILSYDLSSGEIFEVKEYNTVNVVKDKKEVFGAMAFDVTNSEDGADFIFENHPIAGMTLKDDTLYVDIATNLSFIAGKDPHNYADSSSYGYEFEESNYNPDYSEFVNQKIADEGLSDDILEQMGYKREVNDNSEFMWVANAVETTSISHLIGTSHTYAEVVVDPYCGQDGFTENRCTECGAIEADTRVTDEGTACSHHYLLYEEEYYTTKDDVTSDTDPDSVTWNTGESYVCAMCGFHISEPTEPQKNSNMTDEEYEELLAEYEEEKAIYDEAVATAGHTYAPTDAVWSDDSTSVTFSALACSSVCAERQNVLDLLRDTAEIYPVSAQLEEAVTASAEITGTEGTCNEGVTAVYTATGEAGEYKYTATNKVTKEAGQHVYTGEFTWTAVTDDDENVTGYKATANLTCSVCGDVQEDVEAVVEKDEENSVAPACETAGKNVYIATATVTNDADEVIGSATETKEDEVPATGHNYVDGVCTVCGAEEPAIETPVIESVYSKVQTTAKVTWTKVDGASGYELWRATSPDAADEDWMLVKTITDPETVQYTNVDLTVGTTYYYKVRAYSGEKTLYSEFSEVDYMPASIIVDSAYSNLPTRIRFVWQPVDGATEYQLWRKEAGSDDSEYKIVKVIKDQATTAYSNVDLTPSERYTYKMRAVTIKGDGTLVYSAYTDEMTIAVLAEATTLSGNKAGVGRAALSWDSVAGVDGYRIWMSESADGNYSVAKMISNGNTTSYIKSDLESGKTYYFKVVAYTDVDGKITFGQESNVISVTVD